MAMKPHPHSTWTGVVSGDDLSRRGDINLKGLPQDVNVHTDEVESRAAVCNRPHLKRERSVLRY